MKIYWRRLFQRVEQNEATNAIIAYTKYCSEYNTVDRGPHPEGQIWQYATVYRHVLCIDLLFCVLEFNWETEEPHA